VAAASDPELGAGLAAVPGSAPGQAPVKAQDRVQGQAPVEAQGRVPGQAPVPVEELGRALAMELDPGSAEEREPVPEPTRPVPPGWP